MSTSIGSEAGATPPSAPGAGGRARRGRIATALLLAVGVGLGGCAGPGESPDGAALTPEQFIDVIVALREAEREVAEEDSAAALFKERKRAILERHGTTEEDLRGFIVAHRDRLSVLQATWDTITERLKHARPELDQGDDPQDARPAPDPVAGDTAEPAAPRRGPPPVPGGAEVH